MGFLLTLPLLALIPAFIARSKGKSFAGWYIYGLLLWIVAMIHVLFVASDQENLDRRAISTGGNRKCPFCAEIIKSEAHVCKHCGRDLPETAPEAPPDLVDDNIGLRPFTYYPSPSPPMPKMRMVAIAVTAFAAIFVASKILYENASSAGPSKVQETSDTQLHEPRNGRVGTGYYNEAKRWVRFDDDASAASQK